MRTAVAVSNTEIATWTRCPRKWFVRYYLGFQLADEIPFGNRQLGERVHLALEGHYGYQLDPLMVLTVVYAAAIKNYPDFERDLISEREMAKVMIEGYLEWVSGEGADAGLTVVATEQEVNVPLPADRRITLRCRLDQQVRRDDGAILFLDHKTGTTLERREKLALDPQMKIYQVAQHLAALDHNWSRETRLLGLPKQPFVAGGIINMLRRVKRTARAEPPFYAREVFRYSPQEIQSAYLRVLTVGREILAARERLGEVYSSSGGALDAINHHQRTALRPVPILTDCPWSCPLASGTCTAMDDGSDWPGILTSSGRFKQADPYEYYRDQTVRMIKDQIGVSPS